MFRDSFGRGVKIGPTFTDFFVCKIHIIIWTSQPHVSYIWSPSPSVLVGAPKYFWFHQFMACIVMRISRPNYEKSVEKGHLFENSYVKSPPPPTQVVGPRGTQMILISSVYGMHRYGNLATTLWVCWGHMCDSTQGSLCPSPMTIHQCIWIQWSILQNTTYIHILGLHTYYIHTYTYYIQKIEWVIT